MSKKHLVALLLISICLLIAGCTNKNSAETEEKTSESGVTENKKEILKIFHAGSLANPFKDLEAEYEKKYPNIDVQREAAGSSACVRKITDMKKDVDILASADYTLIPKMMVPDYTNWYINFAKNQLVIAFNEESKFHQEITANNWFDILRRNGVKFGFSNPNDDPCGYRSVMLFKLAELHYGDEYIFDDLIESKSKITLEENDGIFTIIMPESTMIEPNSEKIMMRSMETELSAALEAHEIDYFFIYRSVAEQHHFKFIELPSQIDLSAVEHTDFYKKVSLKQAGGKVLTAKPIVYGITIVNNVKNPDAANKFIEMLISTSGQEIFKKNGQPPIIPSVGYEMDHIPEILKKLVIAP